MARRVHPSLSRQTMLTAASTNGDTLPCTKHKTEGYISCWQRDHDQLLSKTSVLARFHGRLITITQPLLKTRTMMAAAAAANEDDHHQLQQQLPLNHSCQHWQQAAPTSSKRGAVPCFEHILFYFVYCIVVVSMLYLIHLNIKTHRTHPVGVGFRRVPIGSPVPTCTHSPVRVHKPMTNPTCIVIYSPDLRDVKRITQMVFWHMSNMLNWTDWQHFLIWNFFFWLIPFQMYVMTMMMPTQLERSELFLFYFLWPFCALFGTIDKAGNPTVVLVIFEATWDRLLLRYADLVWPVGNWPSSSRNSIHKGQGSILCTK